MNVVEMDLFVQEIFCPTYQSVKVPCDLQVNGRGTVKHDWEPQFGRYPTVQVFRRRQQAQNISMVFLICHCMSWEKHVQLMFVQHYLNVIKNIKCFENVPFMFAKMSIHGALKTSEECFIYWTK